MSRTLLADIELVHTSNVKHAETASVLPWADCVNRY